MKSVLKNLLAICFLAASPLMLLASDGYKIRVKLDNYKNDTLVLGYNYGDKQYIRDTAFRANDGWFTFQNAKKDLECGVYLLVCRPENKFIQILAGPDNQNYSLTANADDPVSTIKFKGSDDNEAFYDYLNWLAKRRVEADTMRAQQERANAKDSAKIAEKLEKMDNEVRAHQQKLIDKMPNSMSARIVKSGLELKIPEFEGDDKTKQLRRFRWYRDHYFDNVDISDPCMIRTPVLHQRMVYFVDKLTVQHPDSISKAIDFLLTKCKPAEETYKFYLIHFLNFYAKSNIVGMDAVYVHLADEYYCKGAATWAKKEDLEKICDNAQRLRPILIGKIAPNIQCEKQDGTKFNLYDVDADYTVLFFWAWDCGHCKKAAPFMVDFYKKWKDKGVKVFAVCTALNDKVGECWKGVEEKEFTDFINVVDPYLRSNYKTLYDVRSTPQIFILDRHHEILMKRIGGEEIDKVMDEVVKMEELKKKDGVK